LNPKDPACTRPLLQVQSLTSGTLRASHPVFQGSWIFVCAGRGILCHARRVSRIDFLTVVSRNMGTWQSYFNCRCILAPDLLVAGDHCSCRIVRGYA
jgi:hypothetical protein